jgi:hypothetical protein
MFTVLLQRRALALVLNCGKLCSHSAEDVPVHLALPSVRLAIEACEIRLRAAETALFEECALLDKVCDWIVVLFYCLRKNLMRSKL